jgi:hypothetical protein
MEAVTREVSFPEAPEGALPFAIAREGKNDSNFERVIWCKSEQEGMKMGSVAVTRLVDSRLQ